MEVILLENIENLGSLGDKVTVKPGYARNFLLPSGKAKPATAENLAEFERIKAELEKAAAEALAINLAVYGERHVSVRVVLDSLGDALNRARRSDEAEPYFDEVLARADAVSEARDAAGRARTGTALLRGVRRHGANDGEPGEGKRHDLRQGHRLIDFLPAAGRAGAACRSRRRGVEHRERQSDRRHRGDVLDDHADVHGQLARGHLAVRGAEVDQVEAVADERAHAGLGAEVPETRDTARDEGTPRGEARIT